MPRLTKTEHEQVLLQARAEGAREVVTLADTLTTAGLTATVILGALRGQLAQMENAYGVPVNLHGSEGSS